MPNYIFQTGNSFQPKYMLDHKLVFFNTIAFMEDIWWNLQKELFFLFTKQNSDLYVFSSISHDFHQNGSFKR